MPGRFAAGLSQDGTQYRFHMDAIGALTWSGQLANVTNGARYATMIDSISATSTVTRTHNITDWKFAYFYIAQTYFNPNTYYHMRGCISPDNPTVENPYVPSITETVNNPNIYELDIQKLANTTISVTATTFTFDTKLANNSNFKGIFVFIY